MGKFYFDSHCHYYPCFPAEMYWNRAWSQFDRINTAFGNTLGFPLIGFTEVPGQNLFSDMAAGRMLPGSGGWSIGPGCNDTLLRIASQKSDIYLLPVRQINTAEGLELLLIGCAEDLVSGNVLQHYLDAYGDQYLLVLPWGFGKWLGRRGKVIQTVIENNNSRVLLGDNGGRPKAWYFVPEFQLARRLNVAVLPGSDPLPMKAQLNRVASAGVVVETAASEGDANFREQLFAGLRLGSFEVVDNHRSLLGVVFDQLSLRLTR